MTMMTKEPATFALLPFKRTRGELRALDLIEGPDEDQIFRRGRAMAHRVSGLAFFKIDTSASGDQWTEIEILTTVGDVPEEAA